MKVVPPAGRGTVLVHQRMRVYNNVLIGGMRGAERRYDLNYSTEAAGEPQLKLTWPPHLEEGSPWVEDY